MFSRYFFSVCPLFSPFNSLFSFFSSYVFLFSPPFLLSLALHFNFFIFSHHHTREGAANPQHPQGAREWEDLHHHPKEAMKAAFHASFSVTRRADQRNSPKKTMLTPLDLDKSVLLWPVFVIAVKVTLRT